MNEPPAAPAITVSKNTDTPTSEIDVSWTAPDMTGKPAITGYDLEYKLSGAKTWTDANFSGTGTSKTLTGLTMGKSYEVQVRAKNDEGESPWDSGSAITQAAPSAPGDKGAVTRSVPENSVAGTNVGAAVTADSNPNNYTLTHSLSGTDAGKFTIVSSSGQIKVKSGTNLDYETKTSYSVIVTVKAEEGAGSQSLEPNNPGDYVVPVTINVTDVNEPPPKLAAPTVTASGPLDNKTLNVSWTAPDMTGKPPITGYKVRYQQNGDFTWTTLSPTGKRTSTTITSQVGGVNYNVQVQAKNDEGTGPWSDSGDLDNAAPKLPANPTRSIAENSTKDTNVGTPVAATDPDNDTLYYTLAGTDAAKFEIDGATGQITWADGDATPDYEAKTSYSVTVSVSDKLDSKFKADTKIDHTVTVTIKVTDVNEPPGKPGKPTLVTAATTSLKVKWDAPDMTGKPAIETYWIFYWPWGSTWDDRSVTNSYTSEVLIDEIHTGGAYPGLPLTPGTTYYIQVQAGNDEGYSPKSDEAKLATKSNYSNPAPTPTPAPTQPPTGGNPPGRRQPDNPDKPADGS